MLGKSHVADANRFKLFLASTYNRKSREKKRQNVYQVKESLNTLRVTVEVVREKLFLLESLLRTLPDYSSAIRLLKILIEELITLVTKESSSNVYEFENIVMDERPKRKSNSNNYKQKVEIEKYDGVADITLGGALISTSQNLFLNALNLSMHEVSNDRPAFDNKEEKLWIQESDATHDWSNQIVRLCHIRSFSSRYRIRPKEVISTLRQIFLEDIFQFRSSGHDNVFDFITANNIKQTIVHECAQLGRNCNYELYRISEGNKFFLLDDLFAYPDQNYGILTSYGVGRLSREEAKIYLLNATNSSSPSLAESLLPEFVPFHYLIAIPVLYNNVTSEEIINNLHMGSTDCILSMMSFQTLEGETYSFATQKMLALSGALHLENLGCVDDYRKISTYEHYRRLWEKELLYRTLQFNAILHNSNNNK